MGEFEQIVLLAILQLDNKAYGMAMRREIAARTGRDVSVGALYRTLARLERKEFVSHQIGEPAAERGGRAKKFFRVEAPGLKALQDTRQVVRAMRDGLQLDERSR